MLLLATVLLLLLMELCYFGADEKELINVFKGDFCYLNFDLKIHLFKGGKITNF